MPAVPSGLIRAFRERFGGPPLVVARAPGRVDVLGAHVDYNEGHILAMAIDRHVWVAARPSPVPGVTMVRALDFGAEVELRLDRLDERVDLHGHALAAWARYPAGVAWALGGGGAGLGAPPGLVDIEAAVCGSVPVGAGVSSSAAVEVAFAHAWLALAGRTMPPMELARVCRQAENSYVGVACGLMDQFTSACGQRGRALLLDCRTLEWQALAIPGGASFVLADTGTRRNLSDGALNRRQLECQQAVDVLSQRLPGVRALRDVSSEALEANAAWLPQPLVSRARHIVAEEGRVLAGARALDRGDAPDLGRLMSQSHRSARQLYDASGPALETVWRIGQEHPSCLGGRFVGAGFAGCVLFLVEQGKLPDFVAHVSARSAQAGLAGSVEPVRAAGAAMHRLAGPDRRC
jgi:galactokinase